LARKRGGLRRTTSVGKKFVRKTEGTRSAKQGNI